MRNGSWLARRSGSAGAEISPIGGLHRRPSEAGIPRPTEHPEGPWARWSVRRAMGTPTPLVAPRIRKGLAGLGRVTPARLVAFLWRSMGGVRPSLRPGDSPSARGPGPSTAWPRVRPRGKASPAPRGRNAPRERSGPKETGPPLHRSHSWLRYPLGSRCIWCGHAADAGASFPQRCQGQTSSATDHQSFVRARRLPLRTLLFALERPSAPEREPIATVQLRAGMQR